MKEYYDRRASEYDATSYELMRASDDASDLDRLEAFVADIPPGRTVDIACGTGWFTRLLRGEVVGVDQSEAMLRIAGERVPKARFVRATVPPLPFDDDSFDVALAAHIYCHLEKEDERREFVSEALRVAPRLIVIEEAWRPGLAEETWEERTLRDGSRYRIFKRYYTAERLAAELGGSSALSTASFVSASVDRPVRPT
jgi:demethylmenaquinone methyltransferase/2-methoxy-6-polyprenyl-1,4-benzoquinol methylase